jgi:hypothetical protein
MKKQMKIMVPISIFSIIIGASCTSTNRNVNSAGNPESWVEPVRFEADVNPSNRAIHGDAKLTRVLGLFNVGDTKFLDGVGWGNNAPGIHQSIINLGGVLPPVALNFNITDKAKRAAAYKAVKSSNSDFLIVPRYEVEETNYLLWRTAKARVSGLPGHYSGLRQIPGFRSRIGRDKYVPHYFPNNDIGQSAKHYTPFDKRASSPGISINPTFEGTSYSENLNYINPSTNGSNSGRKEVRRQVFAPSYRPTD